MTVQVRKATFVVAFLIVKEGDGVIPTILIPDEAKVTWLNAVISGFGSVVCHLYQNNHTPDDSDSLGDYIECTWGGYSSRPVTGWGAPLQQSEGVVILAAVGLTFTYNGIGLEGKVFGAYFTDSSGNLLWVQECTNPPRYLVEAQDSVGVIPEIGLTSAVPAAPTGPGGAVLAGLLYSSQNKDSVPLASGQVVAVDPSGTGAVRAGAAAQKVGVGIVTAPADVGGSAQIQTEGVVSLTDWSTSTGDVTLAPQGVYYLDTFLGGLTLTPPSTPGQMLQVVGRALSTLELELEFAEPILL